MLLPLFVGPGRFKQLNQIAGGSDLDAERLHKFHRPGIDSGNVGNRVAWAVLHRHPLGIAEHFLQPRFVLLPTKIDRRLTGNFIECVGLNTMDQLLSRAVRWNEVAPTSGTMGIGQAENPSRKNIRASEVSHQPTVKTRVTDRCLNGFKIEHILTFVLYNEYDLAVVIEIACVAGQIVMISTHMEKCA